MAKPGQLHGKCNYTLECYNAIFNESYNPALNFQIKSNEPTSASLMNLIRVC